MIVAVGASSFAKSSKEAWNILTEKGFEIRNNPYGRKLTKSETIDFLSDADGLLAGLEVLDEDVFSSCSKLKAVARIGIGMDNVDCDAAKRHGIKVSNTPDAPTEAVSEMCLTALLTLSRNVVFADRGLHEHRWSKAIGFSLHGKTILFIGYGRIGRAFAELLKPFGMTILYTDPAFSDGSIELEEGLKRADIISLHASGKDAILTQNRFAEMKDGVVILNSARGSLIDEEALCDALESGKVRSAWLDVFREEPYDGILAEDSRVLLTPHISTYTDRCRHDMEMQAACNIIRDLSC